jgi:O-antigen ligase
VAALTVVAVPIAFDPAGYFTFLPVKWTLASALVAAGLAAQIVVKRSLASSAPALAVLVLLAVVILSAAVGIGGLTSWIGYPGRYLGVLAWATFCAAFVLGASLTHASDRLRIVGAASAGSILVSGYALLQAVRLDPLSWSAAVDLSRTRSTLGNAAFLGAYLVLIVPLAVRLALAAERPVSERVIHAVAAGLGVVALLTTQTRGAWLGALVGLLVVVALEQRRVRAAGWKSLAVAGAAIVVLAVLAAVGPYASRIRQVADVSSGTGHGRLVQWGRTIELIGGRPALGWGPETYAFTFPHYINAQFERTVGREVLPDRAHNVFLDLGASAGVLGMVALLVVLALLTRAVKRVRSRDALTVGLAGSCAAYVTQLQFSFPIPDVDTIFWLFAGLLLAGATTATRRVSWRWAVLPALVAVGLTVWGTTEVVADTLLRRALVAEAHGQFARAADLADRAARLGWLRAQYAEAAGLLHQRIAEVTGNSAQFQDGLDELDRARRLVPRDQELARDEADLLLSWGQASGDKQLVQRASRGYHDILRHDPNSSRVHLTLGVADIVLGQQADAEREWLIAADLAPHSDAPLVNLGRLYEQQGRTADARRVLTKAVVIDPNNATTRQLLDKVGP